MSLYRWDSATFQDWGHGSIIVVGNSIEEARQKALDHYSTAYRGIYLSGVKADIEKEPTVFTGGVLHEYGSA